MRDFWANSILLTLLLVELLTGFFGLVSGSADEAIFIAVHRIAGFAIVAVLFWKVAIIVSSLRRRRSGPKQYASLFLLSLLTVTLTLGFAWSYAGPFTFAWFSGVSWHIYVGGRAGPGRRMARLYLHEEAAAVVLGRAEVVPQGGRDRRRRVRLHSDHGGGVRVLPARRVRAALHGLLRRREALREALSGGVVAQR